MVEAVTVELSVVVMEAAVAIAGRSMEKFNVSVVVPPWPSSTATVKVSIGCEPVGAASMAEVLSAT